MKFGFFKKTELKDAEFKYGFKQQGIFACEKILKGEPIYRCDLKTCDYLQLQDIAKGKTRDETLKIFKEYPESKNFIIRYMYMIDDDLFDWPNAWQEQKLTEVCMYFNHSCDGNCGFGSEDSGLVLAIRDIEPGEELTYDYQLMDTEISFYDGLNCKCGSHKCRGVLHFDQYRHIDWTNANYEYCGIYLKRRIDELKTKWFSSSCYVKHIDNEYGLVAFKKIAKNELVAIYSNPSEIKPDSHYLRNDKNSTCYIDKNGKVFAKDDIKPETELTLSFV